MWNVNGFAGVRAIDVLTLGPRIYPYIFLLQGRCSIVSITISIILKRDLSPHLPAFNHPLAILFLYQALLDLIDISQTY